MEFETTPVEFTDANTGSYHDFYSQYVDLKGDGPKHQVHCLNTSAHKQGDKNPSAFVDTSTGIYGCSVCGYYSPYTFLTDIIGMDSREAGATESVIKAGIAQKTPKYHLDLYKKGFTSPIFGLNELIAKARTFLDPELFIVDNYINSRGLTYETLEDWNIGYLPQSDEQKEECLVFPYYLDDKVFAVKARTVDGRKGGIKNAVLIPYGAQSLHKARIAIICEGETDTLVTYQALKHAGRLSDELAIIGFPGASTFPVEWLRFFSNIEKVYVIPQADNAAISMVNLVIERLGIDIVDVIKLPWEFNDLGKDIADWISQHSEKEFSDLIPDIDVSPFSLTTDQILDEADKEVNWIIPGLIATQEKGILIGAPKTMKTYLALHLTHSVATGKPLLGNPDWTPEPSRVLFVEEEGNITQFARRVKKIFNGSGHDNVMWIHKKGIKLDNDTRRKRFEDEVRKFKPHLIIMDPFKSMHSKDENDNTEMGIVWGIVNRFMVDYPDTAIIFIHHVPKVEKNKKLDLYSARGAGVTAAEVDFGIGLRIVDDTEKEENVVVTLAANIEGRELVNTTGESIISVYDNFDMEITGTKVELSPTKQKAHNKDLIYDLLIKTGKEMTIGDVEVALDITSSKARSALKALVKDGRIQEGVGESQGGRKPKVYYV